ncbi:MAG: (Fe-S)-binding protein [candidate division KSB1 bacterium]|nr:(Fe-S)-binding protein [candidate division KSB1 bacterium]MDZ7276394.1 (Fe-S)-binding protein [candidate division KSB1 bacterium]MDZ7288065.1 (Fe-S)-binding protein [candidate division KSB1 bacterium]MDZ7300164.1 (Fe-S)-binding protein [candidate division KSB1 bacterium]MDZ7351166.1 (Fe-S)-binding protein [candidate division KSB1 bacterium]
MSTSLASVALFIPCLVDQFYPEIGRSMAQVLRCAGWQVTYDPRQTCCGQPAFNTGYHVEARRVAEHFVEVFRHAPVIVAPSGSCVAMVRNFFPELFRGHRGEAEAVALGRRVFEFSEFLVKQAKVTKLGARYPRKAVFHHSCHSYRELRVQAEPLALLREVAELQLLELPGEPVCCGFGGLFSLKFAAIAHRMADSRLVQFEALGAEAVISNDPGCLMQMRQEARMKGSKLEILHLAEVLAGTVPGR